MTGIIAIQALIALRLCRAKLYDFILEKTVKTENVCSILISGKQFTDVDVPKIVKDFPNVRSISI